MTPRPDPIVIEPEDAAQFAAIRVVVATAFAHHTSVADLVESIRASPQYLPELALVATLQDEVVGHVMISRVELEDDAGERHQVLTLSPLAVAPAHQGGGIGSQLVREVLGRAERTDAALVTLEGSPRYYPRFGFRPAADFGVTIDLPEWAAPEAAMTYPLPNYQPRFRGRLVYPPAFADLD